MQRPGLGSRDQLFVGLSGGLQASSLTVTMALILSLVASMRSRCAWTTSTEETFRSQISSASVVASE
jgi:hypothetical protein